MCVSVWHRLLLWGERYVYMYNVRNACGQRVQLMDGVLCPCRVIVEDQYVKGMSKLHKTISHVSEATLG